MFEEMSVYVHVDAEISVGLQLKDSKKNITKIEGCIFV
jgi:hypothetical protein